MSIIEPGTRLANRYLLEDRVSESGGSTLWKAIDEILARPVALRTFDPEFAHAGAVVTAARAASRLTDPRLTQVFDADDSGERAYVVSEWVGGDNLEDLLQAGPMEPEGAAALIGEVAEAIAAAHAAGLAHLRLAPANVTWTTGGTVKVTGLSVEAALVRANAKAGEHRDGAPGEADPAIVDARGLGRLLYAAVTAHWPADGEVPAESSGAPTGPTGPTASAAWPRPAVRPVHLPEAPRAGGEVYSPRQVVAGVPYALDTVICRALGIRLRDGSAFGGPAEVAAALDHVPRTPLPLFMGMRPAPQVRRSPHHQQQPTPPMPSASPSASPTSQAPPMPPRGQSPGCRAGTIGNSTAPRHRTDGQINRPLVALAAVLAVVVVAIGGWQLSHLGSGGGGGRQTSPPASPSPGKQSTLLHVDRASGFDPPPGDGDEKSERAHLAVDGKSDTAWNTDGYNTARFGQLKHGVGLLLDMGKDVRVSDVKVSLPAPTGSVLELRVGDERTLSALGSVAQDTDTNGTIDFHLSSGVQGRYLLLWFTKLAPDGGGRFRGKISDVVVHGPAS